MSRQQGLGLLFGLLALTSLIVAVSRDRPPRAEANHAWLFDEGVGFDGLDPTFGWLDVYIHPGNENYGAAVDAIDAWRELHVGNLWLLRHTTNAAEAEIEIMDTDSVSAFADPWSGVATWGCAAKFDPGSEAFASTFATDNLTIWRGVYDNAADSTTFGFWVKNAGHPFVKATICMNKFINDSWPYADNDQGTIAHELGHALGLDHIQSGTLAAGLSPCAQPAGRENWNSIMAYLYADWSAQYPPAPRKPTTFDMDGPWVCSTTPIYPGGLAYVYQWPPGYGVAGGVGGAMATPTDTPTATRTPTRTPTPTVTPTPTATPVDMDGDGFLNPQQTLHRGPANTDTAYDNCPSVANPSQLNSDGNFIDLSPPKLFDDATVIRSDALGDACDTDDDNDGRSDTAELAGNGCADQVTDPLNADTDGDRALDGAECQIGTDPLSTASAPTQAQCGGTGDADSDLISAFREFCYYGSDKDDPDSDGDGCSDGREMASVNADQAVTAIDSSQVAQAFGMYAFGAEPYKYNFDLTKDGDINATDLSQLAQQFGACA